MTIRIQLSMYVRLFTMSCELAQLDCLRLITIMAGKNGSTLE